MLKSYFSCVSSALLLGALLTGVCLSRPALAQSEDTAKRIAYENAMQVAILKFYQTDYYLAGGLEGIGPNLLSLGMLANLRIPRADLINSNYRPEEKMVRLNDAGRVEAAPDGMILWKPIYPKNLATVLEELQQGHFPFQFKSSAGQILFSPLPDTPANRKRLALWVQDTAQEDTKILNDLYETTLKKTRTFSWAGADEGLQKRANEAMLIALRDQASAHLRRAEEQTLARLRAK